MLLDYKQGLKHQIDTKRQVEEQQRSRHQREVEFYEKTSLSPRRLE
jgi:ribosomal protein S21